MNFSLISVRAKEIIRVFDNKNLYRCEHLDFKSNTFEVFCEFCKDQGISLNKELTISGSLKSKKLLLNDDIETYMSYVSVKKIIDTNWVIDDDSFFTIDDIPFD